MATTQYPLPVVESVKLEQLLDAIGLSRLDFRRFCDGGHINFDKCLPESQLGKYIAKVKHHG